MLFFFAFSLFAQERVLNTGLTSDEQYSFIGMGLEELIDRFGPPRAVFAARGNEVWQDDVVFQYTGVDFYIYRDRIWQVRFTTTHSISNGDRKADVLRILENIAAVNAGSENRASVLEDRWDHVLLPITGKDWPLTLRVNFNTIGQVTAIFLYRSDF